MRPKTMAALLLGLGVVSCGDSISGPSGLGTGNVSASGAVSASDQGVAVFQSVSVGGTSLFQIAVQPAAQTGDGVWQLQIVRYAERPAVGTYPIVELSSTSTDPTANFYYTTGGTMEMFAAVSGELVITSSSPTTVRGTFTFTAESTTNSTRTVTVQGSFAAACPPGTTCL
jgi:Family of unknown function (DUF6252)